MAKLFRLLVVLIVVSVAAGGVYAWLKNRQPADSGFKLVEATIGAITEKALATGQIEPRLKFSVKSKISGIVKRTFVEVGDKVRAGDALFEIAADPTPAELIEAERRVESTTSQHQKAAADWARMQQLHDEGIVSQGDYDETKERHEQSKIELANAHDNLQLVRKGRIEGRGRQMESVIRASASGTVLTRSANVGDPVVPLTSYQAGTELAVIADMSDLIFKGTVDEIDVGKLAAGFVARLKIGSLPNAVVSGKISRIAPQAKEKDNARLFDVEIELDPVKDVVLRAGYSATADLVIREQTNVVTLPERLVTFEDGGKKASVELPGDVPGAPPKKVEVKTGLSDGLNVEITSGLKQGDKVVERPPREIGG